MPPYQVPVASHQVSIVLRWPESDVTTAEQHSILAAQIKEKRTYYDVIAPWFETKEGWSFNKHTVDDGRRVISIRSVCFSFLSRPDSRPDYGKVSLDIGLLCIVFHCLNRGSIVQNRGSFVPNRGQAGDLLWCVPPNRGTAGELLFYENNRVTSPSLPCSTLSWRENSNDTVPLSNDGDVTLLFSENNTSPAVPRFGGTHQRRSPACPRFGTKDPRFWTMLPRFKQKKTMHNRPISELTLP